MSKRKRKRKRERSPFGSDCHILARGVERQKEQVAELKRCRFFCLPAPIQVSSLPLFPLHSLGSPPPGCIEMSNAAERGVPGGNGLPF